MTNKDKLEKLKKLADTMYYAAQQLTTDASRLHKAMEEYHQFIINEYHKEKTVSDLEEEVYEHLWKGRMGTDVSKPIYFSYDELLEVARHFANWQKEQFEKNRLKHCKSITNEQVELEQGFIDQHLDKHQRMPTFLDAIEYGKNLQKEQLMAKAVDGVVHHFEKCKVASVHYNEPNGVPMAYFISSDELSAGDKVKIITIKEG